jgi:crotonobetainyl-CoA:carnitine CoA-transferase CaiB-like acyl-CoA transferase
MAQIEVGASICGEAFMEYFLTNRVLGTMGNRSLTMAPHNNYPCIGEDRWVSIAVNTGEEWQSFCDAMGNPPWVREKRFSDKFNRLRNQDELDKLISDWTLSYSNYEVMDTLQKAGVAAAPCLDLTERFSDPHFAEREVHLQVEHQATGVDIIAGIPFKLSATPGAVRRPAPMLGQHNDYVFRELLGKSESEIAQLIEEKVIN